MTTTEKTYISRSHGSITAETIVNVNGQQWEIYTMKRYNGNLSTTAKKVKQNLKNGFICTEISGADFFKSISLVSAKITRVTEKAVKAQHLEALALFDQKIESGEIESDAPKTPEIGSILFLDGYGKSRGSFGNNHIVYRIDGDTYYCVDPDTLELHTHTHVKPFSEKFGIGIYWETDLKSDLSRDQIADLILTAQEKKAADQKAKKDEAEKAAAERAAKIEAGKKLVSIPETAKSVIIAENYEDQSDSQTDYFWTSPKDLLILGFSEKTRNNGNELKKAAGRSERTAELLKDENAGIFDGYNGLPSYYFGTSSNSGWKISKENICPALLEKIYIAAAENRFFADSLKAQEDETNQPAKKLLLDVVQYSEKSIAIFGDTYHIREHLKSIGARFNNYLKYNGEIRTGWILPKSRENKLIIPE